MLKSTVGQSLNWARSWAMWEFMEMSLLVIYLINLTSLCLTIAFLHCFYVCLMIKGKPTQLYCEALRDAEKNLLRGGGGREESLLSSARALFFPAFQEQAMFHPLPPPQLVLGRAAEFSSLFLEVTETRSIEKTAFFCSLSLLQWKRWADLDPACSLARINPHCTNTKYALSERCHVCGSHSELQYHTSSKCIPDITQTVHVYARTPFIGFFCPSELKQSICSARLYQWPPLCSVREVPFAEQRAQPQTSPELP